MYNYQDISNMINSFVPCKNAFYCPFGCPHLYEDFDFPCIHLADMANLADVMLYWGEYK